MSKAVSRLRAQIVKELLCLLRDPKSRLVLIGPPIIQLLVFSFAATLEVRNIDVAICNRDAGRSSQELVRQIGASDLVRKMRVAANETQVGEMIDRQEVIAGVVIPEHFSRDRESGRLAAAQVLIDGRKANAGQVVLGYLQTIAANAGAALEYRRGAESTAVRNWFNPNLTNQWFVVPSMAGILANIIALLVTALSIARERELGTFDQLLVSPCTPTEIIIAKAVPALIVGTVLSTMMMGVAVGVFKVPFTGSFPALFVCLVLFILSVVGIGLMVSSICANQQQAILGTFAITVPTVLMSGFATPFENMPVALQKAAQCIPLKHFLVILQGSFLKQMPASDIVANAWPMAAIAAVTLTMASLMVRSKLQ